jgi:DNA-binding MarR family transcriptional regulator
MYLLISRDGALESGNVWAVLPCACANLRRAARAVSRFYNRELRPEHIEITQFTLLMALDRAGEVSQGQMGKMLALDSTSLTRMLGLLRKKGWVEEKEGEDRRVRIIGLTTAGRAKLRQTMPRWKKAQGLVHKALGERNMNQLSGMLSLITAMATEK